MVLFIIQKVAYEINCKVDRMSCSFLCMSCAEQVESPEMVDTFPDIYPDYIAVTVPVGIAPLNFTMKDDCERIDIRMQGVGGKELHMNDTDVDIDIEEWKQC